MDREVREWAATVWVVIAWVDRVCLRPRIVAVVGDIRREAAAAVCRVASCMFLARLVSLH